MKDKHFRIGFSPCPNDTFIFDALIHGKIDTEGFTFDPVLEDVETLNEWALEGKLPISKLSFRAIMEVLEQYRILNAGSALGQGCGPLLVSKQPREVTEIETSRIAIPGMHTTANMLLHFAFPGAKQTTPVLFSRIEDEVAAGHYDLGLIIHESRFTYKQKGLQLVMDLGDFWEKTTGYPIPLGGIAIQRSIPAPIQKTIDRLIRKSVEYAFNHYPTLAPFVIEHAQTMEESVMRNHIDLYVNDFSLDLSDKGKAAVQKMLSLLSLPDAESDYLFV